MPPVHFYDERGSALFEEITRLPEYYQGRTELGILERVAPGLVERHGVAELVELGSGASRKTRALLDAMRRAGTLERYVPFDVCPEAILAAASTLTEDYPELDLHGVAGDFGRHLPAVPPRAAGGARLVAFLGGTIGNLEPAERAPFLRSVAGAHGRRRPPPRRHRPRRRPRADPRRLRRRRGRHRAVQPEPAARDQPRARRRLRPRRVRPRRRLRPRAPVDRDAPAVDRAPRSSAWPRWT